MNGLKSFPKDMPEWQAIQDDYNEMNSPAAGNVPFAPELGGPAPQADILPNNYMQAAQQEATDQQEAPPVFDGVEDLSGDIGQGVVESRQVSQADFDKARGNTSPLSAQESMLEEFKRMRGADQAALDSARSTDRTMKIGGAVGDALATVLNAPYQELALQLQKERLGLQKDQEVGKTKRAGDSLALSREKAGQLSDKVATSFADMQTAKEEAKRLLPRVKEVGLGIIGTPIEKGRSAIGLPSKEFQALESDYAGIRNTIRNALFGSALTGPEIEAFEKELNDISISQSGFEDNLTNFISRLDRKMSEKAGAMAKGQPLKEKALKPFMNGGESAPASEAPHGETVERNGKTYKWNPAVGKYQPIG
jgi:Ribonuclease G/E